jgi:hypothetical protein
MAAPWPGPSADEDWRRRVRDIAKIIGLVALAGTIVPPALFLARLMPLETVRPIMLVAAIAWLAAAPFWMRVE